MASNDMTRTSDKSAGPYVPEKHPEQIGNDTASSYDWKHASNRPKEEPR